MATSYNPYSNKIFIGGIPPNTSEDALQTYFEQFGEVYEFVLMHDKYTGKTKGFAFVVYKEAKTSAEVLNKKHIIDGKELICRQTVSADLQNTDNPRDQSSSRENTFNTDSSLRNQDRPEFGGHEKTENEGDQIRRRDITTSSTNPNEKAMSSENADGPINYYNSANFSPKLDYIYSICLEFLYGIKDSLEIKKVGEFILLSKIIKKLLIKTTMINGVVVVGSAAILNVINNSSFVTSLRHYEIAQITFSILYHLIYLLPLYAFSFVINTFDYSDMAVEALTIEGKLFKNRGVTAPDADVPTRIYNEVITALILIFFIIQSLAISFVPIFGPVLYIVTQSFMYAFYCFTYKWGTDQGDLYRILAFFEKHFFYFAGFGFVYASVTRLFPGIMGGGVYAALFPIFLLLSIKATPPRDLEIKSFQQFKEHVRLMFKKKKQDRPVIEYDYINMFNYQEICNTFKHKLGIFTFPLMGKNFIGSYLNKKLKL